ncbi:MAG: hypothetical protein ACYDBP_12460 [Leptospirales bacterium]
MSPAPSNGPLAKKLLGIYNSGFGRITLEDLLGHRQTLETVQRIESALPKAGAGETLATFAAYRETVNLLSLFLDSFLGIPGMNQPLMIFEEEALRYDISGRAGNPVTKEFFYYHNYFDQGLGRSQERFSEIVAALLKRTGRFPEILPLLEILQGSSLAFYQVRKGSGTRGRVVNLIGVTDTEIEVEFSPGYEPREGDLLLARLLPYFTSQLLPERHRHLRALCPLPPCLPTSPGIGSWEHFLRRLFWKKRRGPDDAALRGYLKRGRKRNEWLDLVFEGYAGHIGSALLLSGLPGVPLSLPRSVAFLEASKAHQAFAKTLPPCTSCKKDLSLVADRTQEGFGPLCLFCHNRKMARSLGVTLPERTFPEEVVFDDRGEPHVFRLAFRLEANQSTLFAREFVSDPTAAALTFQVASREIPPDIEKLYETLLEELPETLPEALLETLPETLSLSLVPTDKEG